MKRYKIFILFITLSGCNQERFFICSKDKSQCITVITYKDIKIRYIISGKHYTIPDDKNYIKLDIKNIDKIGDEILGYWNSHPKGWVLYNHQSIILENNLDTVRYKFRNSLPLKAYDVPTVKPILEEDYFRVGLNYYKVVFSSGNMR